MRSTFTGTAGAFRFTLLAGAATFALATPGVALAQDEPEAPEASNVIIVTASKREQTLQETPISVSVTSGETIERAQIRDVLDLQTVVPSLRVSQLQTSSATTFIIRGFGNGDNNFGIEPSVGVFIDGVFRSRSASALSDLNMIQRVEVLNGPQSTLFGKNASAGVISVVTKEPQYEFGGQVEAVYGNFNQVFLRGEVTGPISENIAWSIDGTYQQRDGFGRIVNLNNAEINDRNRWSARGQLLIEPSADVKIRLIADYGKIDEVCCQTSNLVVGGITRFAIGGVGGQFPTDFFSDNNFLNVVPVNTNENYGFSGQLDWSFGNLTLTSITAYRELRNAFSQDVDFTSADLTVETRDQGVDTFTQELRLASDFDGPINFLLGGYYFDESIRQDSSLTVGRDFRNFAAIQVAAGSAPPGTPPAALIAAGNAGLRGAEAGLGLPLGSIFGGSFLSQERFAVDNTSWSVFGTVDFEPIDGLVFTGGFNYTDDKKDFAVDFRALDPLANINLVDAFITGATGGAVRNRTQFQALPAANQAALLAAAQNPAVNPLLGLAALQFQPPFPVVPNAVEPGRTRDDKFTYLLRVAYQISNEVNVYASYATGFKASSINLSRDSRPLLTDYTPGPRGSTFGAPASAIINAGLATPNLSTGTRFAGPENAEVYEIGMKAQWDGFGFNLALFDQTIEGFQSFAFTGLGFALQNAGQQSVKGFEFDSTISPSDNLVFTFAATYLDPVFDSFPGSVLGNLSGARVGGIPEWNLRTSATHTLELSDAGTRLITRVDYSHESNTPINNGLPTFNRALGNTRIFDREVNLVNASMTLALSNGLEIGAFARNLLNDRYILTNFDGVAQSGTVSGYPSPPRTYGGVVRYRF
ncbi:MAG: TonB-dependent receptor [Sphingomonadales bacterium]|nr:MAG: TonB-dependent receptor [Sphingomonadales bacterium]